MGGQGQGAGGALASAGPDGNELAPAEDNRITQGLL